MKDRTLEKAISATAKEFGSWLRYVYLYIVDTQGRANFNWNDVVRITTLAYNSYLLQEEEVKDILAFLKNYLDEFFSGGGKEKEVIKNEK
ncbi:MAG: hypothetical protein AMDU2_EPLC00008G0002 [Thermoplasmatales archaeon E-plasma]|jgi:hypothetical protein|nr:MAG: hypothetical protein AMDU2_EPLC00008G0002 [Thermoplasmatales archaeon E-plasma]EQB69911.1 MAG: hypothetical protein AMDU5_GPLC00001G0129 [Thermoplasmatales archaeon Gpl]